MEVKNKRLFGAVEVTEPRAPAGDPYRMRQRPLTVDELAELAAHLHIAHLTELQRLRDFQRRYQWPAAQDQGYGKPRHQIIRNLKELFDTVQRVERRATPCGAPLEAGLPVCCCWWWRCSWFGPRTGSSPAATGDGDEADRKNGRHQTFSPQAIIRRQLTSWTRCRLRLAPTW
ncbi:unnamed protein product [Leptidea sinapis]|uniref:Uncharacterized protein n=1 Tax=Leptidea sinapis TaxID=189913 RepID=A0A5E4R404_9NEOP|nr:unnamed protein product [Leptidea sinapis]